jgi:hypothetical protein
MTLDSIIATIKAYLFNAIVLCVIISVMASSNTGTLRRNRLRVTSATKHNDASPYS